MATSKELPSCFDRLMAMEDVLGQMKSKPLGAIKEMDE